MKDTITEQTKVPLSMLFSAIALAVIIVACWADLRSQLGNTMTTPQFQEWLENAREMNPSLHFPRVPPKSHDQKTQAEIPALPYLSRKENP